LSDAWLARPDQINAFYEDLRDRFQPNKPVWITETADAACGGNPWAATFLDSFRYLDQLGPSRQARCAGRLPRYVRVKRLWPGRSGHADGTPELLGGLLMGSIVLDPGPSRPGLHLYAHRLRERPGGVSVLAINTNQTEVKPVELIMPARRYTLTAKKLENAHVQLNGHALTLTANGELPVIEGESIPAGQISLAPASITFLAIADAGNKHCQ
jgi:heparanase